MNKRLWSGVMAGIMAVSSSVVLELPAVAQNYELMQTTLGGWDSQGQTIALGGIANSSSTILITCTAPAGLKEDVLDDDGNETGETKTPEEVCGIILDNDWDNSIPVSYDSETGVSTYTLTYDQFSGKRVIIIQNHTNSDIQVTVEAVDFEEDSRETPSTAAITDDIAMEISRDDNSSWLVGNIASTSIADPVLTGQFKGKTVGEFRAAVGKVYTPAVNYVSDTAGAGKEAFVKQLYIECDDGWFGTGDAQQAFALDEEGTTYIDGMFPDDSNDSLIINEIGTNFDVKYEWDGDLQSCRTISEEINALPKGYNIFIETTDDGKETLELPAASGTITMNAYNDESNSWLYGSSAGGAFTLDSVDGVTYGTTTMKEFREKYKYIRMQDLPFFASSIESLTLDQLNQNIGFEFSDGSYLGLRSNDTSGGNLYGLIPNDDSSISDYDDRIISKINIDINVSTYYDQEKELNVSVNSDVSALNSGDRFIIELTEDTRGTLEIPSASGEVVINTFNDDSDWYEGINAEGKANVAAPEGITYEQTTLKQLKDGYKTLNIPEVPFSGCSLDGITADDFKYTFEIFVHNGDDWHNGYYDAESFAALKASVDVCVENLMNEISNPEDYVISGMDFLIRPKSEYNSETGKHHTLNEAIKALGADKEFTVVLTEDARGELSVPAVSAVSTELHVFADDSWLDGVSANVLIPVEIDGITSGQTTVKDLRENYKAFNIAAQTYYADSVDAGADAFVHNIKLITTDPSDGSEKHLYANGAAALTSDGTFRVDDFNADGQDVSSGALDAYVIDRVEISIDSATEYDESTGKNHAVSDAIRNLSDGSNIMLEFREDTRQNFELEPIAQNTAYLYVANNEDVGGMTARADFGYNGCEIVGKTVSELLADYKSISLAAPGYFTDSAGANASAYSYRIELIIDNDDGTDTQFLGWYNNALDKDYTLNFSTYSSVFEGREDYKVVNVNVVIESTNGENGAVSEAVQALPEGSVIVLELREDTRAEEEITINSTKQIQMEFRTQDDTEGSYANTIVPVSAAYVGKTIAELKNSFKKITTNGISYIKDTEGYSAGDYAALFIIVVETDDGEQGILSDSFELNKSAEWYTDFIDGSYDEYIIKQTGVLILSRREENENGKLQAVNEKMRGEEVGKTYIINPQTVKNFKAAAANKSVTLTWDAVDYPDVCYNVYVIDDSGEYEMRGTAETNSFAVSDLESGKEYTFAVGVLTDGVEFIDKENTISAVPKDKLSAPENVKATAGDKQVTITWDKLDGATQYRVQRLNNTTWSTVGTVTSTSFTNTGLTNGTSYSYRVLAFDGTNWGAISAVVAAVPKAGAVPQNVKATAGDKQVKLTWSAVENATQYRIQRLNNTTWSTVGTVTSTSFTNTGLTNGTSYSYRVLALVDGKWSSASAAVTAKPAATSVPQNVKATAGDKQVKLTWSAVENATQYRIQRLNNTTWGTIGTVTSTSFTNTGLTNGTSYSYRVLALVDGKWSSASAAVTATPAAASVPQNIKAAVQIKLTWDAVENATQYRIQRLNGTTWGTIGTATSTSYTDTGLTGGTSYSYRILALVDGKWSSPSAAVSIKA